MKNLILSLAIGFASVGVASAMPNIELSDAATTATTSESYAGTYTGTASNANMNGTEYAGPFDGSFTVTSLGGTLYQISGSFYPTSTHSFSMNAYVNVVGGVITFVSGSGKVVIAGRVTVPFTVKTLTGNCANDTLAFSMSAEGIYNESSFTASFDFSGDK